MIAIIVLLAALLLPALKTARAKAKQIGCLSNLRQINSGVLLYATDFNGYPPSWFGWPYYGPWNYWPDKIAPYTGVKLANLWTDPPGYGIANTVFRCPAYVPQSPPAWGEWYFYVYCASKRIFWESAGDPSTFPISGGMCPVPLASWKNPAELISIFDGWGPAQHPGIFYNNAGGVVLFRHNGRVDILYVDGHVAPSIGPGFPIDACMGTL